MAGGTWETSHAVSGWWGPGEAERGRPLRLTEAVPLRGQALPRRFLPRAWESLGLSNTPDWPGLSRDETFHSCSGWKLRPVLKAELKDVCKEAQ